MQNRPCSENHRHLGDVGGIDLIWPEFGQSLPGIDRMCAIWGELERTLSRIRPNAGGFGPRSAKFRPDPATDVCAVSAQSWPGLGQIQACLVGAAPIYAELGKVSTNKLRFRPSLAQIVARIRPDLSVFGRIRSDFLTEKHNARS